MGHRSVYIDPIARRSIQEWLHHLRYTTRDKGETSPLLVDGEDDIGIGISDIVVATEACYRPVDIFDIELYLSWVVILVFTFVCFPGVFQSARGMHEPLVSTMPEHRLRDKIGLPM